MKKPSLADAHRARILTWAEERSNSRAEAEDATSTLRVAVCDAVADGMSESEAARLAGVTRMTVRAWQGK